MAKNPPSGDGAQARPSDGSFPNLQPSQWSLGKEGLRIREIYRSEGRSENI